MKKYNLDILIIAVRDPRERYRFISEPLSRTRLNFEILKDKGPFLTFIFYSIKYFRFRGKIKNIIIFGGSIKNFFWYLMNLFIGANLIMREGGDPLLVYKSYIKGLKRNGRLLLIIKAYINYILYIFLIRNVDEFIIVNESIYPSLRNIRKKNTHYVVIPPLKEKKLKKVLLNKNSQQIKIMTITNFSIFEKYLCLKKILTFFANSKIEEFQIEVNILGGGSYLKDLENFSDCLLYNKYFKINIHGFLNDIDVFLSKADIFFYVSELDSTPNAILEAMSFGLPILLNNYLPFKNIINTEGVLYFNLENKNDFIKKLYKLSSDAKLRKKMGTDNLTNIKKNYSTNSIAKKLESYFLN